MRFHYFHKFCYVLVSFFDISASCLLEPAEAFAIALFTLHKNFLAFCSEFLLFLYYVREYIDFNIIALSHKFSL
jgi:hypothetical protein